MIKLSHFTKLIITCAAGTLIAANLAACSHGSSSNTKKVLMACYAVTNAQAGQILGSQLDASMLSGENSPIHVCAYNDAQGNTVALLQISETDSKDPTGLLASDAAQQKALFKKNIVPIRIHVADGFGPGAFYLDNTTGPTTTLVQLRLIENGYRMMVQINNPKDFSNGEKQAAAIAQQALTSINNKKAFKEI
jgi:hypothetical protein